MNGPAGTKEAPRDLSRRSAESEWLDGADVNPEELELVLRDLARFNGAMLGHWPVIDWLRRATRDAPKETALWRSAAGDPPLGAQARLDDQAHWS